MARPEPADAARHPSAHTGKQASKTASDNSWCGAAGAAPASLTRKKQPFLLSLPLHRCYTVVPLCVRVCTRCSRPDFSLLIQHLRQQQQRRREKMKNKIQCLSSFFLFFSFPLRFGPWSSSRFLSLSGLSALKEKNCRPIQRQQQEEKENEHIHTGSVSVFPLSLRFLLFSLPSFPSLDSGLFITVSQYTAKETGERREREWTQQQPLLLQ